MQRVERIGHFRLDSFVLKGDDSSRTELDQPNALFRNRQALSASHRLPASFQLVLIQRGLSFLSPRSSQWNDVQKASRVVSGSAYTGDFGRFAIQAVPTQFFWKPVPFKGQSFLHTTLSDRLPVPRPLRTASSLPVCRCAAD